MPKPWTQPLLALISASSVVGCTPAPRSPDAGTQSLTLTLTGAVAKGPFVLGSSVSASPVDEALTATGSSFRGQTTNDLGEFDVGGVIEGPVALEATGFAYNEITGQLSTAPITLRAWARVSESAHVAFINVITHLTSSRVPALVGNGDPLEAATAAAESELLSALDVGLPPAETITGTSLNLLGGDTDANAYLFLVSAVVAQAASARAGPVDANI